MGGSPPDSSLLPSAGSIVALALDHRFLSSVQNVESGYMGGIVNNPSYGQICTGDTGHAEAVHVKFDPSKVSATELIEIFFKMHDPTTKNRQGADVFSLVVSDACWSLIIHRKLEARDWSAIFCHTEEQKRAAEEVIAAVQPKFGRPIVTEINTASTWYPADKGHQDYYRRNKSNNGYCKLVIHPKLSKVKHDKFKSNDGLISKLLRR
eukprot:jgi/Undpi1/4719/HiC_scaffold_18.g08072.m1